jgi:hypothetical protein
MAVAQVGHPCGYQVSAQMELATVRYAGPRCGPAAPH